MLTPCSRRTRSHPANACQSGAPGQRREDGTSPGRTRALFRPPFLGAWMTPTAGDALLGALTDESALVRAGAARGLGEWAGRRVSTPRRITAPGFLAIFPLLKHDPANEARWAAAEAMYQVSGEPALRPVQAAVRRWCSKAMTPPLPCTRPGLSAGLGRVGQPHLWSTPTAGAARMLARQSSEHCATPLRVEREQLLFQAQQSSDQHLRELAQAVSSIELALPTQIDSLGMPLQSMGWRGATRCAANPATPNET